MQGVGSDAAQRVGTSHGLGDAKGWGKITSGGVLELFSYLFFDCMRTLWLGLCGGAVTTPSSQAWCCWGTFPAVLIPPSSHLASRGFVVHLFLGNCSVRALERLVSTRQPDKGGVCWPVYFILSTWFLTGESLSSSLHWLQCHGGSCPHRCHFTWCWTWGRV